MDFIVQYRMDEIGYSGVFTAGSEEGVRDVCVQELKEAYPLSVIDIIKVEKVKKK